MVRQSPGALDTKEPPVGAILGEDIDMRSGTIRTSLSFAKVFQQAMRNSGNLLPAAQDRIREDLRLRFEYAGEYVAYIDRWKIHGKVRRLCREVLGHSPSLKAIQDAIAAVPAKDQPKVVVDYADDPDEGVELPHDVLDR